MGDSGKRLGTLDFESVDYAVESLRHVYVLMQLWLEPFEADDELWIAERLTVVHLMLAMQGVEAAMGALIRTSEQMSRSAQACSNDEK